MDRAISTLFLDIETISTTKPGYRERVSEAIKHPAQMKKQETIDKWIAEEKQSAIDEAIEKTVFNGGLCHVAQIQYSFNDEESTVLICNEVSEEKANIQKFFDDVSVRLYIDNVVGHNVINFDLKVIKQRAIVLGLKLPIFLSKAIKSKAWDGCVFDTMTEWAGYKDTVSMDNLCYYLDIETPKQEITGATYGDYWRAKEFDKCRKYGADEIVALKAVYNKLTSKS